MMPLTSQGVQAGPGPRQPPYPGGANTLPKEWDGVVFISPRGCLYSPPERGTHLNAVHPLRRGWVSQPPSLHR